jgi:diguanylate cyclase (GGDEF)-like protein/PAS domain S-box-containing protein
MGENVVKDGAGFIGKADKDEVLLAGYPGAAVIVSPTSTVLRANPKGAGLETLISHDAVPEIKDLVAKANGLGTVAAGSVSLQSSKGEISLELTVLPVDPERLLVLARDLTMDKNLRSALVESRQRYKDLVEVSSDFSWETSAEGSFMFVSTKGAIGYTPEELIDHHAAAFTVDPESFSPLPFHSKRPLEDVEIWLKRKDGETACMMLSCVPLFVDVDGKEVWSGTRGVCRDVTAERQSEAALARARHREQILGYIVSMIRDELEPENMLTAAATAVTRALEVTGCRIHRQTTPGSYVVAAEYGTPGASDELDEKIHDLDVNGGVMSFDTENWHTLATATQYRKTANGAISIWRPADQEPWDDDFRILLSDVANQLGIANEQIANHERIVALSRTDSMTGLLNRRAFFEEELPRRVARLKRNRETAALFYVDMDNFKLVNDVRGHQAGDDAIMLLRDMLMEFSRPGDVIARLGGDEFAMWLDGIPPEATPTRAEALKKASMKLQEFSGSEEKPLGLSVGIAIYDPAHQESFQDLVSRADEAMYGVKNSGKGGYLIAPPPKTQTSA